MKTNFKRIIGLGLSLILALGVFAGCSNNKNDNQLEAIKKAGKIVVGIEGTYPPFTYHDPKTDELAGIDVELAKAIGEKLGVEVEFVEAAWESLLSGVDSGRLDTVINNVGVSDERKEKYDFSDSYLYIPKQVVVKGDNEEIKGVDDLNGKKVATSATNAFNPWFESKGATVVAVDTSDEAASLILSGRADFVNFDPLILKSYLDEHPDADLKVAFSIPDTYEATAIPIRKGETELLDEINKALRELSEDGTLAKISEKYVDGDYTQKP
ncbi:MAG: transporter substrate-binding domain-containing protein [Ruminococcus flavefaciens]|nr:transporter substrate-binding domain-containing protein [Ruminococcus flavefaciens]